VTERCDFGLSPPALHSGHWPKSPGEGCPVDPPGRSTQARTWVEPSADYAVFHEPMRSQDDIAWGLAVASRGSKCRCLSRAALSENQRHAASKEGR
jgi:hypothetical protein